MKQGVVLLALLFTSGVGLACDESGAFGVAFGGPVPGGVDREMYHGGSVKNAMGCFMGEVPKPDPAFYKYTYCANKDRKTVYGLEGYVLIDEGRQTTDSDETRQKAREIIYRLKKEWEEKFGLVFEQDTPVHDLSWTAQTEKVTAIIRVFGKHVTAECTHNELQGKAFAAGMKSW